MPLEESFAEDRHSLQLQFIYPPSLEEPPFPSRYVSSFGILRDQFRSFFGDGTALSLEASSCAHSVASARMEAIFSVPKMACAMCQHVVTFLMTSFSMRRIVGGREVVR